MSPSTWPSSSDLSQPLRPEMVSLLNHQLADTIDLGLQARHAHWNVKGSHFVPLHALFEEVADALTEMADEIAERAVQLGGIAEGTLQVVATNTRLASYKPSLLGGELHLRALGSALAALAKSGRAAIDAAAAAGDSVTADVLTEVTRSVDKLLWKVTAHLMPVRDIPEFPRP